VNVGIVLPTLVLLIENPTFRYTTHMTAVFPTPLRGVLSVLKTKDIHHIECCLFHVCECDSYV